MPNSAAQDLTTHLQTLGAGTIGGSGAGWHLFTSIEPPLPNTTITLYDAGGYDPDPQWLLDQLVVNVRIRGAVLGYPDAYAKAQAIKDLLLGIGSTTIGGSLYVGMWLNGDIIHLGQDQNDRPLISMNFRVYRQPATGTNRESL